MEKAIRTDSGFTLLEILITIAISGLVMVSALKVFENSNKSYVVQEDVAQMQQNARMAKYYIERDLRIAGYALGSIGIGGTRVLPFDFVNNTTPQGDVLTIKYIEDEVASCGTPPAGVGLCSDLPQLNLKGKMPPTSTVATVQQTLKDNPPFASWDEDCWCGDALYEEPSFGYMAIITSSDGLKSDIVFITGVSAKKAGSDSTLSNGPNFVYEGLQYENKVINTYDEGSTINFFNSDSFITLKYYVDSTNNFIREENNIKNTIAENIEDFQVSFCGDYNFNNKGVPDQADAAGDWISNSNDLNTKETTYYNNAVTEANKNSTPVPTIKEANTDAIRFVKISLIARTSREHKSSGMQTTRPALEDHPAATTSDYYRRRPISVTVRVRNLGL